MTNSQTSNNELDKILTDLTNFMVWEGHQEWKPEYDRSANQKNEQNIAKQQLSNLIKEIIGRKKPYKGGDFGYWSGQQYLREDQRQRATNLGFNIGDK